MGWFDSQIKERKKNDDKLYEDAFAEIANAVSGKRVADIFNSNSTIFIKAVTRIMESWGIRCGDIRENVEKLDPDQILEIMLRPHGIMHRRILLSGSWYKDAYGPILARLKSNGLVVALIPRKTSGYYYYDEDTGKNVKVNKAQAQMFEREAVSFFCPFPQKKLKVTDCMIYLVQTFSLYDLLLSIALLAGAAALGILLPKINYFMLSQVLEEGYMDIFATTILFMICLSVSRLMLLAVQGEAASRVDVKMNIAVMSALMMRILSLPSLFFREHTSGELYKRISDVGAVCEEIIESSITVIFSAIFSLIYIFQISRFAPSLTIPSLVIMLMTLIVSVIAAIMQTGVDSTRIFNEAKENSMIYSIISGMRKIKLVGAEKRVFSLWAALYSKKIKYPPMLAKMSSVIILSITLIGNIVIYYSAVKNEVSVADYYAFNTAYAMIAAVFTALSDAAVAFAHGKTVFKMAEPILEAVPETSENKAVVTRLNGNIEFSGVSFRYNETSPFLIDNLSLKIRSGEYVAIVGRSGCGKSTLVRLLLGLERPQRGAIYYDGRDMEMIDLRSLRSRMGTVMQNGALFAGSIFKNITMYAPWLNMDDAWRAAEAACIADDIRDMPMGMNTLISERSGGFSGGQKQRIMIASAIAPNPKILIFDEATSALDNITQKKISDALYNLKCTRIVIAHRLSTIKNCDRILVIDEGHIAEDGTYEELIAQNGIFAELIANQR